MHQKFVNIITSDNGKVVSTRINHSWFTKNNHEDLWNWFLEATSSFQDLTIHQRAKLVVTDQFRSRPGCENCGKPVQFIGLELSHCCSRECEKKVPKREKKHKPVSTGKKYKETGKRAETIKQKTLEKSGFETYKQLVAEIKNRLSQNHSFRMISDDLNIGRDAILRIIEEYELDVETDRSEVIKNGVRDLYGVDNVMNVEEFREHHKEMFTKMFEERGEEILNRSRKTLKDKTGYEHALQNPTSMLKFIETNKNRYGVSHFSQIEGVSKEIYRRVSEKHGGTHPIQTAMVRRSKGESELADMIIELVGEENVVLNTRSSLKGTNQEIDIYIPNLNLGIEYCGMYHHSESGSIKSFRRKYLRDPNEEEMILVKRGAKKRHKEKFQIAKASGIQLLTIWCYEWQHRRKQVLNFIRSKLGVNRKIYARKCVVVPLKKTDACQFINENHIQEIGPTAITHSFGLEYEGNLIAVMSFGRHQRGGDKTVLNRLCFEDGVTVVGGASKLFNFAQKSIGFRECISWSDNRWSHGNVYQSLGFEVEEQLPEEYCYFSTNKSLMLLKQSATREKLGARDGQSEAERAAELKLHRIWDCGKIRWVWKIQP